MANADDRIFGMCLMNDWSARHSSGNMCPLGPFGAKNLRQPFYHGLYQCTGTVPVRYQRKEQLINSTAVSHGSVLWELRYQAGGHAAVRADARSACISRSNFRHLYWSIRQQLVHHSVTGCNMNLATNKIPARSPVTMKEAMAQC